MNNGDDHWHRDLGRCILCNSHGDSRGDLRGDSGGDQIEVVAHDQGQRNAIAVRIKGYEMQSVFCKGSGRRFCIEEDGGALKPKTGIDAAVVVVQVGGTLRDPVWDKRSQRWLYREEQSWLRNLLIIVEQLGNECRRREIPDRKAGDLPKMPFCGTWAAALGNPRRTQGETHYHKI